MAKMSDMGATLGFKKSVNEGVYFKVTPTVRIL